MSKGKDLVKQKWKSETCHGLGVYDASRDMVYIPISACLLRDLEGRMFRIQKVTVPTVDVGTGELDDETRQVSITYDVLEFVDA